MRLERALLHLLLKPYFLGLDPILMPLQLFVSLVSYEPVGGAFIGAMVSLSHLLVNPQIDHRDAIFVVFEGLFVPHHFSVQGLLGVSLLNDLQIQVFVSLLLASLLRHLLHMHGL